ncbi:hypothetical protein [Beijerinckia indica]|uniref:Uncharacterized protein n=1 Tax=Beijerinckia indica subsp. indica (strain ATCC 9039 / DSM 1715 / NCIMB 8712) TaxID=395963 RepID=B2IHQ7_BEII9|nr:hypothetical protein [Beijerinckia indica]ACB94581.1 hypothetical protein Bind_0932 [Beijerinckia indica subsp. indica ATCC 9039]
MADLAVEGPGKSCPGKRHVTTKYSARDYPAKGHPTGCRPPRGFGGEAHEQSRPDPFRAGPPGFRRIMRWMGKN